MADFTMGLDVAHHQKPIDWQKVAAAGYRYVFVRATYGAHRKDRRFEEHWAGAQAAGLLMSSYHFMRTTDPVDRQIDMWLDVLGDRKLDLPLALDVENDPTPGDDAPMSRAAWTEWTLGCLDRLAAAGHARPVIYTAGSFWNNNVERSDRWGQHPLWVAHYTEAARPILPRDWPAWGLWQFTSKGTVPGIDGNVDVNRFLGGEADLMSSLGGGGGAAPIAAATPRLAVRVAAPVNIRSGPSIKHDKAGMFTDADVGRSLPVFDVDGQDAWVSIGADRWIGCAVPSGPLCRIQVQADGRVQARVLARGLNVRRGPGPDFDDVGDLKRDDVADVLGLGGSDCWVRWGPGQWTALQTGNQVFLAVDDGARDLGAEGVARAMGPARRRKRPRGDEG